MIINNKLTFNLFKLSTLRNYGKTLSDPLFTDSQIINGIEKCER